MENKLYYSNFQQLDIYIIDNILSNLKINEVLFINKKYYNQNINICKNAKDKIHKFYKYNRLRLEMEFHYYDNSKLIQIYYKICYPKEYRSKFMKSGIKYLNTINRSQMIELYNLSKLYPHKLNYYFRLYVPLLNIQELAYIGW
jgi:hypothetical protein